MRELLKSLSNLKLIIKKSVDFLSQYSIEGAGGGEGGISLTARVHKN